MVNTVLRIAANKAWTLTPARITIIQNAVQKANYTNMMSRSTRGGPIKYVTKQFPYKTKRLWNWNASLDQTRLKLENENAKLIVVDGPIAAGKAALAKALAEEFDLHFIEDFTMDEFYISPYGYDFRNLDPELPPNIQSMDHRKFCMDPFNINTLYMQSIYFTCRFMNYCDAMSHILNTGQGVIMPRSYFSDHVMAFACMDEGYIRPSAKEFYERLVWNSAFKLFKPHLIIYLDIPVPVVQERIKARGYNYEVNGKALTPSYLSNIEKHYKEYLKNASKNSKILVYDWTDGGEIEGVIEDIEEIDFIVHEGELDPMFEDWKKCRRDLRRKRLETTNEVPRMVFELSRVLAYDHEEMWYHPDEVEQFWQLMKEVPGGKYAPGCNPGLDKYVYLMDTFQKGKRHGLYPFYGREQR